MIRPKVLIIGLGNMGKNHLKTIVNYDLAEEILVFDTESSRTSKNLGSSVRKISRISEISSEKVDYAVIATPTSSHLSVVQELGEFCKLILIEKPIALSSIEANKIINAVNEGEKRIYIGHVERFNPSIAYTKKIISDGVLGRIQAIFTSRQSPRPLQVKDSGVISDLASHDFDLIGFLTESWYEYLDGETLSSDTSQVEDCFVAQGRLKNGVLIAHNINWISPRKERKIMIYGEAGVLEVDMLNFSVTLHPFSNQSVITFSELSQVQGNFMSANTSFAFEKYEPLLKEHEELIKILNNSEESIQLANVFEATRVVELIEAMYKSKKK